jgi:5-methylcytosine-specific restriction enzyme subunit McrC
MTSSQCTIPMHKTKTVFEHEFLQVDKSDFTEADFARLVKHNEQHGNRFFSVGHQRIKFNQFVGVIQVGGLTIEVLPKVGKVAEEDQKRWRWVLVDMLDRAGCLKLHSQTDAHLRVRHASLFEIYLESFLCKVRELVHQGLTRKYRCDDGNLPVLKGRLVFSQHVNRNLVHRERFYTAHQRYDRNNVFNRILKEALAIVGRTVAGTHLASMANELLLSFEDVTPAKAHVETFQRLRYDRNTERYKGAMTLAELIILNYAPDVQSGRRDVIAILFDMNDLFERYVFAELHRAQRQFAESGLRVDRQRSQVFWGDAGMRKTIRPDITAEFRAEGLARRLILDTKWKMPPDGRPSDADLKQMYVYNLQFGACESYLVYPRATAHDDVFGWFAAGPMLREATPHGCGMWFVDLLDGERLDRQFGKRLCDRIISTRIHESATKGGKSSRV